MTNALILLAATVIVNAIMFRIIWSNGYGRGFADGDTHGEVKRFRLREERELKDKLSNYKEAELLRRQKNGL